MGLDMYLEKLPKVEGFSFEKIDELIQVVGNAEAYDSAQRALKDLSDGQDAKETAIKHELMYFNNDTPDRFKERLSEFVSNPENIAMYGQYLLLTPPTVKALKDKTGQADEIAYWRKANHIHNWFVKNVQNGIDECQSSEVSKEQLEQLLSDCKKVLKHKDQARETLPTASGFFFGGTDYDEYYFQDIKNTIQQIETILNDVDFDENYVFYVASW